NCSIAISIAESGRPSAAPGGRVPLGGESAPVEGGEALRALVGERGAAWEAVVRVEARERSESAGRARGALTAARGCRGGGVKGSGAGKKGNRARGEGGGRGEEEELGGGGEGGVGKGEGGEADAM
ncbi:unnamed protein product, partial [Closterium sp. NIES-54]